MNRRLFALDRKRFGSGSRRRTLRLGSWWRRGRLRPRRCRRRGRSRRSRGDDKRRRAAAAPNFSADLLFVYLVNFATRWTRLLMRHENGPTATRPASRCSAGEAQSPSVMVMTQHVYYARMEPTSKQRDPLARGDRRHAKRKRPWICRPFLFHRGFVQIRARARQASPDESRELTGDYRRAFPGKKPQPGVRPCGKSDFQAADGPSFETNRGARNAGCPASGCEQNPERHLHVGIPNERMADVRHLSD